MAPAESKDDDENVANGGNNSSNHAISTAGLLSKQGEVIDVTIHPLVLLSAADHYHRVARGTRKRVVGVLLGTVSRGKVDATNSFAVPFEEDSRNPAVFYLDHNYLENMLVMFRKVSAKERVVGFYSTGPQIRPNDLRIHDIVSRYVKGSVTPAIFCIIDVRPDRPDLPVTAYKVVEETDTTNTTGGGGGGGSAGGQTKVQRSLAHLPCSMGALEAEEVGVEHLLRDINDPTVSTTTSLIQGKLAGLATLTEKLVECKDYLASVAASSNDPNKKPPNPEIIANLQTVLSLLPNLNTADLVRSMFIKCNDMYMSIYLASLIRTVMALHDLVNNKIRYGPEGLIDHDEDQDAAKETSAQEEKKQDDENSKTKKQDKSSKATDNKK